MKNIRDPVLEQMVKDFQQESTTRSKFHMLDMHQIWVDQVQAMAAPSTSARFNDPKQAYATTRKGWRKLIQTVNHWAVRIFEECSVQVNQSPAEMHTERTAQAPVVIDSSCTVVNDEPPASEETLCET